MLPGPCLLVCRGACGLLWRDLGKAACTSRRHIHADSAGATHIHTPYAGTCTERECPARRLPLCTLLQPVLVTVFNGGRSLIDCSEGLWLHVKLLQPAIGTKIQGPHMQELHLLELHGSAPTTSRRQGKAGASLSLKVHTQAGLHMPFTPTAEGIALAAAGAPLKLSTWWCWICMLSHLPH